MQDPFAFRSSESIACYVTAATVKKATPHTNVPEPFGERRLHTKEAMQSRTKPSVDFVGARLELGITQTDAASALGIPRGTLYNWESGRCNVPADQIPALAELVNIRQYQLVL